MKIWSLIIGFVISQLVMADGIKRHAYQLARKDGTQIDYYLTKASETSPNLLLILQGSDCNSVFNNDMINQTFSQVLTSKDVLTIEKYGITSELDWHAGAPRSNCPQSTIQHDSPSQRLKDIKQVLAHVLSQNTYLNVIVIGGSEGALMAIGCQRKSQPLVIRSP